MDVSIGDEITADEAINGTHQPSKDNEYSLNPGSTNAIGLDEMITPGDHKNSLSFFVGTLAETRERIIAAEQVSASTRHDNEDTFEELTLRDCNSEKLDEESNLSSRDKSQTRQNRWHHLLSGSGYRGSQTRVMNALEGVGCTSKSEIDRKSPNDHGSGDAAVRFNIEEMSNVREDLGCTIKSGILDTDAPNHNCNDVGETRNQVASSNVLLSSSSMRTKILSRSGFTQYFVKDTLKGKGVVCRGPAPRVEFRDQSFPKASNDIKVDTNASLNSNGEIVMQVNSGTLLESSRDKMRSPPRVTSNSATLMNSYIETVIPPTHASPSPVTNSNRDTLRPPARAFPNTAQQTVTPLTRVIANSARQTVKPLRQAIPNPVLLSNSNGEAFMPRAIPSPLLNSDAETSMLPHDSVSLRQWLKFGRNKRNMVKSLRIFKQIVDVVSNSHSKGIALLDLRPSYFKLLQSNEVKYVGSNVQIENLSDPNSPYHLNYRNEKRPMEHTNFPSAKRIKPEEDSNSVISWPQFPNKSGLAATGNVYYDNFHSEPVYVTQSDLKGATMSDPSKLMFASANDTSEEVKWYASPEELNRSRCTLSSNIYSLGVLLFELLCSFDSERGHDVAMLDVRNRILPPSFLSGNPREAGFCLWLLHPEPSSRPTTREILKSDVIKEIGDLSNLSSSLTHDYAESDLLLHFLETLQQQKNKHSSKLMEEINLLEADIEEVEKRRTKMLALPEESLHARGKVLLDKGKSNFGVNYDKTAPFCNEERLMKNVDQLESVYFSVRSTVDDSTNGPVRCDVKELLEGRENFYHAKKDREPKKSTDGLGLFYNGLCKYARYTKFKVRGTLRNGDFSNANVICSLSFDPNEEYFAAAGVSKKIKIYDFHAFLNSSIDIHYPVIELSNRSKLSCTSWNNYIRNYLASTDYDGMVKLWDAGTGQEISQYAEHGTRAWSVDFSRVDPTKLASGSDDCSVKLWNITEKSSICTIRNVANVCCVQFSPKSSHLLAFGAADYKTYCYDLRNTSKPWCILSGHARAVSYVKFLDSETLISASTDSTLKLWDLNKTGTSVVANEGCISTLRGHTNEKNFVGLSVTDDGYIVCGSETNEVFAYYRSLPMPITSHKFGSIDPISGKETDDDGGHFVSSVCWRKESEMVVAANSSGSIKLLQMI
ncbi:protein SPA1-RELATED 2 [Apium graveolens]|uniref:protein SPA1-RELATED 2 n=1 Tax=Apium graveolens TaxID=4045 RepID=UPI003D79F557